MRSAGPAGHSRRSRRRFGTFFWRWISKAAAVPHQGPSCAIAWRASHTSLGNVAEAFARNASLTAVDVLSSPLSGTRKVIDVIFSYINRTTDVVEKFFTRVDVTEEFPFLVTKLSPYYDR